MGGRAGFGENAPKVAWLCPCGPLGEPHPGYTLAGDGRHPFEWHTIARSFLQHGAVGGHRLLQSHRLALTITERQKGFTEVGLHRQKVERDPPMRPFLQRRGIPG